MAFTLLKRYMSMPVYIYMYLFNNVEAMRHSCAREEYVSEIVCHLQSLKYLLYSLSGPLYKKPADSRINHFFPHLFAIF